MPVFLKAAAYLPLEIRLEPSESNPLTPHLLVDPEDDRGLCHEFLSEAVSRFPEDETVKEALVGAIEELSRQLSKLTMNDDYKPYVLVSRTRKAPPSAQYSTKSGAGDAKFCTVWAPCIRNRRVASVFAGVCICGDSGSRNIAGAIFPNITAAGRRNDKLFLESQDAGQGLHHQLTAGSSHELTNASDRPSGYRQFNNKEIKGSKGKDA